MRFAYIVHSAAKSQTKSDRAYFRRLIKEHDAMLDAMAARDADTSEALARDHVLLFQENVVNFMRHSNAAGISVAPSLPGSEQHRG